MHSAPERFETERLILRRARLDDAPAKYEYAIDPAVARYMNWTPHATLSDAVSTVERAGSRWVSGEEFSWSITVRPNDVAVGNVACFPEGHAVELGFVLAQHVWGQGYATEAASAVLRWLSIQDGVVRVWATCDVENTASVRVLEKLGMQREGLLRRFAVRPNIAPGVPRDAFLYAWVRES